MDRSKLSGPIILAMIAMLLAVCAVSTILTIQPTSTPTSERKTIVKTVIVEKTVVSGRTGTISESRPTAPPCTPSTIGSFPDTLEPTDVLIELKSVPSGLGSPPEGIPPCDLFPTFTLLADGGAYYIDYIDGDWRQPQTMVAHLTPEEMLALIQRVLDLGFECLTSWSSQCGPSILRGRVESICIEDAGTSVLQVHLPDGRLKTIRNYGSLANDPGALKAILTLLSDYQHPEAQPYAEKACLCFDPWLRDGAHTTVDWPQEEPWLTASDAKSWCNLSVDGSDLETLLTVTGRNRGFFKIRAHGRVYGVQSVSWPRNTECETPSPCPPGIKCNTNVCWPAESPSSP